MKHQLHCELVLELGRTSRCCTAGIFINNYVSLPMTRAILGCTALVCA